MREIHRPDAVLVSYAITSVTVLKVNTWVKVKKGTASCHKLSNYQHAAMSTAQRALIKTALVTTEKVITYL